MKKIIFCILCFSALLLKAQGPYAPAAGQPGSTAIHKDSSVFAGWATNATVLRGWQNISNISAGKTTAGDSLSPTGKSGVNGVVSLGDNGSVILTFDGVIKDGPGADFAVFENSFDGLFLELAFVEVSSDGVNFFRFDAVSLTDTTSQTNSFGNTDPTNLYNLAGKYKVQYGTPFDLSELTGISELDVNHISHVKIIDVVGSIAEPFATHDSHSHAINDPWPTEFPTGGFDLDAVGVINFTPTSITEQTDKIEVNIYPNPASDIVIFDFDKKDTCSIDIFNSSGTLVFHNQVFEDSFKLNIQTFKTGLYFVKINCQNRSITKRILKY